MSKEFRMLYKTFFILAGIVLFCLLADKTFPEPETKEEEITKKTISPVWVLEAREGSITYFYENEEHTARCEESIETKEVLAELVFYNDVAAECREINDKVTGKLLGATDSVLILPDRKLAIGENMKIYRLYGTLEELSVDRLPIGCENTDFVMEDGKVCACLVHSEKDMETIRVLIQNSNYGGIYHESVEMTSDCAYTAEFGEKKEEFPAGKVLVLTEDDARFRKADRVIVRPMVNTGKIRLNSVERAVKTDGYRGYMEVWKTEEGLAVINELLLEEYLYGVVPSEMPFTYPKEALMAQAVCARTYAYNNLLQAGLPVFGAHVDDSTAFQVYHNTEERAETTTAVKETKGQVLFFETQPVNAYYYSTSCGYGTDINAWKGKHAQGIPYLKSKAIADENGDFYEKEEPWYRWEVRADITGGDELAARLKERYKANPELILTKTKENDYISQPIKEAGRLKEIKITDRTAGGSASEMLLEFEKETYLVMTEYNIRYVLCVKEAQVTKQDGSKGVCNMLLPSSFFELETGKEEGYVVNFLIKGGGYGHGIGMSQNGAKNMALAGKNKDEILAFFYEGSRIETLY